MMNVAVGAVYRTEKLSNEYGHRALMYVLEDEFEIRRWKIGDRVFSVSGERGGEKADVAGAYTLSLPDVEPYKGHHFALGVKFEESNLRPKLYVGSVDTRTSLGYVFADALFEAEPMIPLDVPNNLGNVVDKCAKVFPKVPKIIRRLVHTGLADEEVEHILMKVGRENKPGLGYCPVMPWSRIGEVDHAYHETEDSTEWGLLEAFSRIVRKNSPREQMEQLLQFYRRLPRHVVA